MFFSRRAACRLGHGSEQFLRSSTSVRENRLVAIQHPDWQPAIETMEIFGDPEAMAEIIEAEADIAAGNTVDLSEIRMRPGFSALES